MEFNFTVSNENGTQVIALQGKLLEKEQADKLIAEVDHQINSGNNELVLDLEKLIYLNSTGLNVMISLLTKTRNAGGELLIANIPEKINKLFIVTKLNTVFIVINDLEEAAAIFKKAENTDKHTQELTD